MDACVRVKTTDTVTKFISHGSIARVQATKRQLSPFPWKIPFRTSARYIIYEQAPVWTMILDSTDGDSWKTIPELRKDDDLVNWRRRVKEYLHQQEVDLLGLIYRSIEACWTQHKRWIEKNVKVKRRDNAHTGWQPMRQSWSQYAWKWTNKKFMRSELDERLRMYNTKILINVSRDLETIPFDKDEDWWNHFGTETCFRSASPYVQRKMSKILRLFITRFAPNATVAESSSLPF